MCHTFPVDSVFISVSEYFDDAIPNKIQHNFFSSILICVRHLNPVSMYIFNNSKKRTFAICRITHAKWHYNRPETGTERIEFAFPQI